MLCAHTVRRLKPGTFDQFASSFGPTEEEAPKGWVSFHMLRSLSNPDEVVTFGFFDGTFDELEASQKDAGYEERRDAVSDIVDEVVVNGVYEIARKFPSDG
jgi:hypothetical protein